MTYDALETMPSYVVKPGDTLLRIAHRFGLVSWKEIYDHADNAGLRELRPDPSQLLPGDVVVVPEPRSKQETVPSGRLQSFQLKRLRAVFRMVVEDEGGRALGGRKYTLRIDDKTIEGTTEPDGSVELEIEPDPKQGRLIVWPEEEGGRKLSFKLSLGHLAPAGTPAGLKARLRNLGFEPGTSKEIDSITRSALRAFQIVAGLPVTGEADDHTVSALTRAHDKG